MPAVITHDLFGKDAYADVSALLHFSSFDQHDAFLLGNQGPDPLFFLVLDPTVSAENRVGDLMHHDRPAHLVCALRDSLSMLSERERPIGEAYAAGFLCHYLLDATTHPLIISEELAICRAGVEGLDESDGGEVHAEIERDLDEMVLFTKVGKTIADWRPYREALVASDEVLAIIDKMYFYTTMWTYSVMLDLDAYTRGVKSMRRLFRLLWSKGDAKRAIIGSLERPLLHKRYPLSAAMAHRVRAERSSVYENADHAAWEHPFTHKESTESFWDLYEEALAKVFDMETGFFAKGFDLRDAVGLTGCLNFSGEVVDEGPIASSEATTVGTAAAVGTLEDGADVEPDDATEGAEE